MAPPPVDQGSPEDLVVGVGRQMAVLVDQQGRKAARLRA